MCSGEREVVGSPPLKLDVCSGEREVVVRPGQRLDDGDGIRKGCRRAEQSAKPGEQEAAAKGAGDHQGEAALAPRKEQANATASNETGPVLPAPVRQIVPDVVYHLIHSSHFLAPDACPGQLMKKYDKSGDGKLDENELGDLLADCNGGVRPTPVA